MWYSAYSKDESFLQKWNPRFQDWTLSLRFQKVTGILWFRPLVFLMIHDDPNEMWRGCNQQHRKKHDHKQNDVRNRDDENMIEAIFQRHPRFGNDEDVEVFNLVNDSLVVWWKSMADDIDDERREIVDHRGYWRILWRFSVFNCCISSMVLAGFSCAVTSVNT